MQVHRLAEKIEIISSSCFYELRVFTSSFIWVLSPQIHLVTCMYAATPFLKFGRRALELSVVTLLSYQSLVLWTLPIPGSVTSQNSQVHLPNSGWLLRFSCSCSWPGPFPRGKLMWSQLYCCAWNVGSQKWRCYEVLFLWRPLSMLADACLYAVFSQDISSLTHVPLVSFGVYNFSYKAQVRLC